MKLLSFQDTSSFSLPLWGFLFVFISMLKYFFQAGIHLPTPLYLPSCADHAFPSIPLGINVQIAFLLPFLRLLKPTAKVWIFSCFNSQNFTLFCYNPKLGSSQIKLGDNQRISHLAHVSPLISICCGFPALKLLWKLWKRWRLKFWSCRMSPIIQNPDCARDLKAKYKVQVTWVSASKRFYLSVPS